MNDTNNTRKQSQVPIFNLGPEGSQFNHVVIVGTSGKGKSLFLAEEAKRRGISLEELELEMQPTPEQFSVAAERKATVDLKINARNQAVKDAFWNGTDDPESEFSDLKYSIIQYCGISNPTVSQLKAAFDLLPMHLIGSIIQWDMGDTEVRENIGRYFSKHADELKLAVNKG